MYFFLILSITIICFEAQNNGINFLIED